MHAITIFCGANLGQQAETNRTIAFELGKLIAIHGYSIVTGGGPGMMQAVAEGCSANGGYVIGMLLREDEGKNTHLFAQTEVFETLADRQKREIKLGEAFIALPGGMGTLFEVHEILEMKHFGELPTNVPVIMIGEHWQQWYKAVKELQVRGFMRYQLEDRLSLVETPQAAIEILGRYFK
jgi:hypothetical protein